MHAIVSYAEVMWVVGSLSILRSLASTVPWWAIVPLAGVLLGGGMVLKYWLLMRALDKGESAKDLAELARALDGRPGDKKVFPDEPASRKGRPRLRRRRAENTDDAGDGDADTEEAEE